MNTATRDLSSYLLPASECTRLNLEFPIVCHNANLLKRDSDIAQITDSSKFRVPGIYFWTMIDASGEYKVYVGRTRSLHKRITDYSRDFQPHSVNDFKLRVFQQAVLSAYPGFEFRIRFQSAQLNQLTELEKGAIRFYKPLLNARRSTSPEAKQQFLDAFVRLYSDSFAFKHDA